MGKSNRSGLRASRGTVTVIDVRMHHAWARKARIAYVLTALAVWMVAGLVATAWIHNAAGSMLLGLVIGNIAGAIVWVAVRVWPYARVIWWWTTELAILTATYLLWVEITSLPLVFSILCVTALFAVVVVPPVRRRIVAVAWCLIVRHRLRTCFAQFIVANRSGSLPLILLARPTPVGERVWLYLRPGLSLADLANRAEKLAVACHAASVIVDPASASNAAYVRLDIKRREVLDVTVASPLGELADDTSDTDSATQSVAVPIDPAELDLTAVLDTAPVSPASAPPSARTHVFAPTPPAATAPVFKVPGTAEDLSDWID